MKYYITHFIKVDLPEKGMRKLKFITTNTELHKKKLFLFGKGHKTYNQEKIENDVVKGKIIALPKFKELHDGHGLWVDSMGKIFYADYKNPDSGKKEEIFSPEAMTRPRQIFDINFGHLKETSNVKHFVKLKP